MAMVPNGVCQPHENKNFSVRVRGISFGLERGIRCGTTIGVAVRRESNARARYHGAQGRRSCRIESVQRREE
jgi:hypothetical protein